MHSCKECTHGAGADQKDSYNGRRHNSQSTSDSYEYYSSGQD